MRPTNGPRQITAVSPWLTKPMETIFKPYFSMGAIFPEGAPVSCLPSVPVIIGTLGP